MLLNNFYYIDMASAVMCASPPTKYYVTAPNGTTKVVTYSTSASAGLLDGASFMTEIGSNGYFSTYGFCLGRGSTPATKEDYKLEDMITSGLSRIAFSTATNWYDDGAEKIWSYTMQNTSDADITICEIGKIGRFYSGGKNYHVLVDRTVLNTPITIPAGETKVLSHSIRINYPA